jgi:hypothetical protein
MTDDFIRPNDEVGVNPRLSPEDANKAMAMLMRQGLTILVDNFTIARALAEMPGEQVPVVVVAIEGSTPGTKRVTTLRLVMPFYMTELMAEGLADMGTENPHD